MFIDRIRLELSAGKGGNGVVAWRREKYIPKGGPTGGNGGKGGSIILKADVQLFSLDSYRNKKFFHAEKGGDGGPNRRQGKKGKDLVIKVPCGTLVKDTSNGVILYDFTKDKEEFLICQGGKGGRGNDSFKTATNQAPNYATMGKPGENKNIELELKLIADIGFVGFPNAGKSSLFQAITKVETKRAAYPFTTLRPSIGFMEIKGKKRIFFADIPGIIEDAHKNRGLGLDFLRHIERTKFLLFVLDASGIDGRDPLSDFTILKNELGKYDKELLKKPSFVVLNKIDMEMAEEPIKTFLKKYKDKRQLFLVSTETEEGLGSLQKAIQDHFSSLEIEQNE